MVLRLVCWGIGPHEPSGSLNLTCLASATGKLDPFLFIIVFRGCTKEKLLPVRYSATGACVAVVLSFSAVRFRENRLGSVGIIDGLIVNMEFRGDEFFASFKS